MAKQPDLFILSEHAELLKQLRVWDIAYHQNDAPLVDDATYDAAKKRALEIEEMYPELAQNGASTHVGAAVSDKFSSFAHSVPMLSISDVFDENEVADWFNKFIGQFWDGNDYYLVAHDFTEYLDAQKFDVFIDGVIDNSDGVL